MLHTVQNTKRKSGPKHAWQAPAKHRFVSRNWYGNCRRTAVPTASPMYFRYTLYFDDLLTPSPQRHSCTWFDCVSGWLLQHSRTGWCCLYSTFFCVCVERDSSHYLHKFFFVSRFQHR